MLYFDLGFLEFLINPSYEYLKEDIKIIQNAYLETAKNKDKDKKNEYFKNVNYLFLQTPEELKYFIVNFCCEVIYDVYNRLFKVFSINIDNEFIDKDNNFIDSIFLSKGLENYTDDIDLSILRNDIRKYLVNVTLNSTNERDVCLAKKAISEIDSMLEKFNRIEAVLVPRFKQVVEVLDKKETIRDDLRRKFILEYDYLLSDKGKRFIQDNDDYNVLEFLCEEQLFCKYFDFYCDEVFLTKDIKDSDLSKRRDRVKHYNDIYNEMVHEYKYMDNMTSLVCKKIEGYVNALIVKIDSDFYVIADEKDVYRLCNSILDDSNHDGCYYCFKMDVDDVMDVVKFLKFFNLRTVGFKNHKFVNKFYNTLCHEIGHNFDYVFPGYCLAEDYNCTLYDIYNEYRAEKLFLELVNAGNFNKSGIIHCVRPGKYYSDRLFMLLDLFENYKEYFDEYVLKDNDRPLRDLFGDRNFIKLINRINDLVVPGELLIKHSIKFGNKLDKLAKRRIKKKQSVY